MATSNLPIIKVTATTPGDKNIRLTVFANNIASVEKAITQPIKPDPTPVTPPVNIYPPEELLTARTSGLSLSAFKAIPYLGSAIDSAYGSKITKITQRIIFNRANMGHGYSKRQPWNADGTFFKIGQQDILNGTTYKYDHKIPGSSYYGLWSNTDPNKLYQFSKSRVVYTYNPVTKVRTVLKDFASSNYDNVSMTVGNFEGNISNDDTYVLLNMVKLGVKRNVLFNLQTATIVWDKSDADLGATYGFDWIGVSQNGSYVMGVKLNSSGASLNGTVYDLATGTVVTANAGNQSHRDCGIDAAGNQVITGMNYPAMHSMTTGTKTDLITSTNWASVFGAGSNLSGGHSSARNIDLPGWACFSITSSNNSKKEIFMAKLDSSHLVRRFCQSYCSSADGSRDAFACPEPNGRRIAFCSDAMDGTGEINTYIVEFAG